MITHRNLKYRIVAIILALNYATFQLEPFEDEYKANHSESDASPTISHPSVTWESFDKENAPKAFVFLVTVEVHLLCMLEQQNVVQHAIERPHQPVRDKSPPLS